MKDLYLLLSFLFSGLLLAQPQPYYDEIDFSLNGTALKLALADLITETHVNQLSYNQVWNALKETDKNPENSSQVILVYGWENTTSGQHSRTRGKDNNGGSNGEWNREHVYAKSLGSPNLGQSGPGADAHHLRASDVQWNNARGSKKFAAGSGNSDNVGAYWYPGDEWKGDVARMMMYMYVRYGIRCLPANVGVGSSENTPDGMIDLFLQWNAEDPVSEIEIQRNNYLGNINNAYSQGNRNPFIDNPYLATKIWGGPAAEDIWGTLSTTKLDNIEFSLYPNPNEDNVIYLQSEENITSFEIININGRILSRENNPTIIDNTIEIAHSLQTGMYFIKVTNEKAESIKKLLVH